MRKTDRPGILSETSFAQTWMLCRKYMGISFQKKVLCLFFMRKSEILEYVMFFAVDIADKVKRIPV